MDSLKDRIARLSRTKLALLEQRLNAYQPSAARRTIPRRSNIRVAPPLSFGQQRLWFLHHLDSAESLFNDPAAIRFKGQTKPPVVAQVLSEIDRRHDSFRTSVATVDADLVQVIAPHCGVVLPVIDLSHLAEILRVRACQEIIHEVARREFSLSRGPLWRDRLIVLADDEHVLLVVMHHMISDGWSTGIMIREMKGLYEAFSAGNPSRLSELTIQYADYAVWQRQRLTDELLEQGRNYWRHQLEGAEWSGLLSDRTSAAATSFRSASRGFELDVELSRSLAELSRREGATLFMTLFAAFAVLLHRYSKRDDIVVGTVVANRDHHELESIVGFFVNIIALRADLSGDPTFRELLSQVRRVALEGYAHQDFPFERLVGELGNNRSPSQRSPLPVLFMLQTLEIPSLELPGLTLSLLEVDKERTEFELALTISRTEDRLTGLVRYSDDLFGADRISILVAHYQTLLNAIVADVGQPISSMRFLSQELITTATRIPGLGKEDFEDLVMEIGDASN